VRGAGAAILVTLAPDRLDCAFRKFDRPRAPYMTICPPESPVLRSPTQNDLTALLSLNQAAVPHVGSIFLERMVWFADQASYFRIAEVDGAIVGFLLGLTPEADYGSLNFRWFQERYASFVYIDRIVVDSTVHRSGVGATLYSDIEMYTHGYAPVLACEVNLNPPNPVSMAFHEARGFRRVGSMQDRGGEKEVCFMIKDIPVG